MKSLFRADAQEPVTTKITPAFVLLSFIVGALAGTTGDFVHVITNTDGYPANGPFPFLPFLPVNMPVWVPFLFGSAVLLMAASYKLLANANTLRLQNNRTLTFIAPFLFVLIYALTGFVQGGTGSGQDAWLALVTLLLWWFADRSKLGVVLALLNAIGGTLFEMFLVHSGAFYYYPEHSNFFGVPSWLPWLYMIAGICISLLVRWIR